MSVPRIELHLHLEGAAPPELIRALAAEKGVDLSGVFAPDGGYATGDFTRFLATYEAASSVLASPADYARLTRAVAERLVAQGVIHAEVFTAPQIAAGGDVARWREMAAAVDEAAASVPGITIRQIATCVRHFGPEAARDAARCAVATAGTGVTGWGMGGDERMHAPADFAWAFDCAREAGLGLTCHAGEFGGPESVRAALDDLRVGRIGHGVRAVEDAGLVARLAAEGVVLEVCPGSNVALGLYGSVAAHPIDALRRAGVRVTVSTDDPPFFRTDMDAEHAALAAAFGWGEAEFRAVGRTAAEAAFCDEATRARLLAAMEP